MLGEHAFKHGDELIFVEPDSGLLVLDVHDLLALGEVDDHGAVVHLVGDRKGGVVLVRGTDEPGVVRDMDGAVVELCGKHALGGHRHQRNVPLLGVQLEDGQEVRKVVLHAREVHLVEHHHGDGLRLIIGAVEGAQEGRLRELFGKFVEVAEDIAPVLPRGLHRGKAYVAARVLRKVLGKRRLARARKSLQNDEVRARKPCQEGADGLHRVEHVVRLKVAVESLYQLGQREPFDVLGRRIGARLVLLVDLHKIGEDDGILLRLRMGGVDIVGVVGEGNVVVLPLLIVGDLIAVFDGADCDAHNVVDGMPEHDDARDDRKSDEEVQRIDDEEVVGRDDVHEHEDEHKQKEGRRDRNAPHGRLIFARRLRLVRLIAHKREPHDPVHDEKADQHQKKAPAGCLDRKGARPMQDRQKERRDYGEADGLQRRDQEFQIYLLHSVPLACKCHSNMTKFNRS